jgi:hypothetical protein
MISALMFALSAMIQTLAGYADEIALRAVLTLLVGAAAVLPYFKKNLWC